MTTDCPTLFLLHSDKIQDPIRKEGELGLERVYGEKSVDVYTVGVREAEKECFLEETRRTKEMAAGKNQLGLRPDGIVWTQCCC